ncbi:hypothetical protein [Microtetraspora malaysiensis]|uniref:hypothetical protein n=1 Tax=Microtetraspora malaysiensis TaxID=161358 RepID=UPI003D950AB1
MNRLIAAGALCLGLALAPTSVANASAAAVGDPYGHTFPGWVKARNNAPLPVYSSSNFTFQKGWLDTTTSGFLCKTTTRKTPDGQPIWAYYTQGDRYLPDKGAHNSWGFVWASGNVSLSPNALPQCKFNSVPA